MSNLNKNFKETGKDLKQAIENIKRDYDLVYFTPSSSKIKNIDTGKCMAVTEYDNLATVGMKQLDGNLHTEESCKLNVGMIQSENTWKDFINNKKPTVPVKGLNYKLVQGYFNNNPQHFNSAPVLKTGVTTSFASISQGTNGGIIYPNNRWQHRYSVEWTGTFTPRGSGYWYLWTGSDDASFLWLGKDAIKNYNVNNALVRNGGLHGMRWAGAGIRLEKGQKYPIRIQFGENWGGHNMWSDYVLGPDENNRYQWWRLGDVATNDFNAQDTTLYYSLVENTPELTKQGLYNCYIADTTNSLNTEISSKSNSFNYKVIWSALDEASESEKINPSNYAYYRNGALFVCDENGNILKQIGETLDENSLAYNLSWTEVVYYLYRYPDLMRAAGGPNNSSNWQNFAQTHWRNHGKNENRTFEEISSTKNLKLHNDGNISLRGSIITTVDGTDAVVNPDWKSERNILSRKNYAFPYDRTGGAGGGWPKGDIIRRTSWDNQTLLISENGKFKLEMSESGNLIIKMSISGCTGNTPAGMKFTKKSDNQRGENYYLYKTDADMKIDKLFVGQANNNIRRLKRVNESGNDLIKGNKYLLYNDYAPTDTTGSTIVRDKTECETKCNDDKSCDYYYSYVTNDEKTNCKIGKNAGIKQFIPIQPESGIKSSQLYIRDTVMNLPKKDIRNMIPRKNTNNYQSYSAYEVSPALYELGSGAIMQDSYTIPLNRQNKLFNGKNSKKIEPFENHGYESTADVNRKYGTNVTEIGLAKAIQDKQITPMTKIAQDYDTLLQNISKEYNGIDTNIKAITNSNETGLRDKLIADKDSGYLDTNYDMGPPMKKAIDVRLDDIDEMISQTNTIYSLGTVTAMTLIIAGIFLARN